MKTIVFRKVGLSPWRKMQTHRRRFADFLKPHTIGEMRNSITGSSPYEQSARRSCIPRLFVLYYNNHTNTLSNRFFYLLLCPLLES